MLAEVVVVVAGLVVRLGGAARGQVEVAVVVEAEAPDSG